MVSLTPNALQTEDGQDIAPAVGDRDNAGALGAVNSGRTSGDNNDMALNSNDFDHANSISDMDWKGQLGEIKNSIPEGLRGMFGGQLAALEKVMELMEMLQQNGAQGVGGPIPDGSQVSYQGPDGRSQQQILEANQASSMQFSN